MIQLNVIGSKSLDLSKTAFYVNTCEWGRFQLESDLWNVNGDYRVIGFHLPQIIFIQFTIFV